MLEFPIVSKKRTQMYIWVKSVLIGSLLCLILSGFVFEASGLVTVFLGIILFIAGLMLSYVKEHIEIGLIRFSNEGYLTIWTNESLEEIRVDFSSDNSFKMVLSSFERKITSGVAFSNEGTSGLGNYIDYVDAKGIAHRYEFYVSSARSFDKLCDLKRKYQLQPKLTGLWSDGY